jgi:hypothetical protein
LQRLGDCGLDGGKTRITPQKHRYWNKVSQLAAQRYYGRLSTQRFHEQPVAGHSTIHYRSGEG